jgi:hypothetical protein
MDPAELSTQLEVDPLRGVVDWMNVDALASKTCNLGTLGRGGSMTLKCSLSMARVCLLATSVTSLFGNRIHSVASVLKLSWIPDASFGCWARSVSMIRTSSCFELVSSPVMFQCFVFSCFALLSCFVSFLVSCCASFLVSCFASFLTVSLSALTLYFGTVVDVPSTQW